MRAFLSVFLTALAICAVSGCSNEAHASMTGPAQELCGGAAAYEIKTAKLMTRWSSQVSQTNPLPEYPRPQRVRPQWLNPNGIWEFSAALKDAAVPTGKPLPEKILVPYPVESALSGLMRMKS